MNYPTPGNSRGAAGKRGRYPGTRLLLQAVPSRSGWLLACLLWQPPAAWAGLHHALDVILSPDDGTIEVTDTITRSGASPRVLEFALHPGLTPEVEGGARLQAIADETADRPPTADADPAPRRFRVELPHDRDHVTLHYRGRIRHALQQGEEYARGFQETPGTISPQGVFLAGRSFWYPRVAGELVTFKLDLQLPPGWSGMTQGTRVTPAAGVDREREQWRCDQPQEEIYLIAGRFTEYRQAAVGVQALVLLRAPDRALAQKYLDVTADYIRLYSELIGPYPYSKFALVENFWETGYGMPSFTLLGPRVIRLPFILHSSYPHEILHNWWGNSVYIDYAHGNWAEGLTSYLADHLIKEQRGHGAGYRRSVLQKYTDHVRRQKDFPLTAFRGRHSAVTEAVGYGKTLMLFHMLRRELGDADFIRGLRTLYEQNRFRVTGFAAVEDAFNRAAGQPLAPFFAQWVQRAGAPELRVARASAAAAGQGYRLSAVIEQVQPGAAYRLTVPVAVHLAGEEQAWQTEVRLERKTTAVELELPARPLQLDIDPQFDVFRRLHRNEIPPAVSQAMGAERVLIVLPVAAPERLRQAYEALARDWQVGNPDRIGVVSASGIERLPDDRTVWLFGWSNRFRPRLDEALVDYQYESHGDTLDIEETTLTRAEHAVMVLGRHPGNPDQALGWLAAENPAAVPGLGRKLPHYGKYSYLAFTGEAPDNVLKGQWPVLHSPLSVPVAQADGTPVTPGHARLAARTPLVAPLAVFSTERMQHDIAVLAAGAMDGRGLGSGELDRAADYIAGQFAAAGLAPGGDAGGWLQVWQEDVPALGNRITLKNVIGILPGSDPARAGESLVIGAHYDHLGRGEYGARTGDRGQVHPGADDNASGVAVLLELARFLAGKPQPRSIVFVAFTGEEAGRLGSQYFIQYSSGYPVDRMIAMVNLDTVGRLGERPLLVLGTGTAEEWVHILRGAGYVTGVPVKPVADDIGSSDQTSFIAAGVPAVQLFSGAHADFHRPGDTPARIDAAGLVKTAQVLKEITSYLAARPEALHSDLGQQQIAAVAPVQEKKRRVSLGLTPDYAFEGEGVRIDALRSDTPAFRSGLRPGDIITALNDAPVPDLRAYAQLLKGLKPGDSIRITIQRDGSAQAVTTRVIER